MATVLILLAALLASGVGLIYTKHQSRQLFMELQTLQAQRDELEIEWGLLQLEQSSLASEAVVDQAARERLEMRVPIPEEVTYINRLPEVDTTHPQTVNTHPVKQPIQ